MELISWKPLEGESAKAYKAFKCYLDLGEKRSQQLVAKKMKTLRPAIGAWASRFRWTERVITWHHDQTEMEHKAQEQAALEKAREREARKTQVQDAAWEMCLAMREKVMSMLKFPIARQRVESQDGMTVTIIEPVQWRFGDVARVGAVADTLARLATGMPTSNGKLTVQDPMGAPLPPPIQTLIQVAIVRSKDANTTTPYKMLPGELDEDDEKQAAEA